LLIATQTDIRRNSKPKMSKNSEWFWANPKR